MDRIRPLDPPHKGIRNALGQVSFALGTTDFGAASEVAALRGLVSEVVAVLRDHARQEDHYIFAPAEAAVPGSTTVDAAMHDRLEAQIDAIATMLDGFDGTQSNDEGNRLVQAFHEFHLAYLEHMLHEEQTIEPILLETRTDEQMIADQGEVMQTVPFEMLLLWFKYIVPARRTVDNRQVLGGFKAAAPPEAFAAVCAVLRDALPPERYAAITNGL